MIHACRCVGQALEGPPPNRCSILVRPILGIPRTSVRPTLTSPVRDHSYHRETGVRELVAGDNSLFVAGVSPGPEICSGYPLPPAAKDCLLCELNEPKAIKIPSVPFRRSIRFASRAPTTPRHPSSPLPLFVFPPQYHRFFETNIHTRFSLSLSLSG